MTAYLFGLPKARPLTAAGAIMPGAYLQFYDTGTTTPADVYSDAALTTPLDNPVVADASGEFAAIYLDPETTYRVQLYDAADVLQYDIDPYAPPRDFPAGTILMFYGTEEALEAAYPPDLWQQLDGNNGAPDIRNRFPIGVSSDLDPGDTGGSSAAQETSAAGGHDHGGDTGEHTLTTADIPAHNHRLLGTTGGGITDTAITATNARGIGAVRNNTSEPYVDETSLGDPYVEDTGDGGAHDHSITAADDHTHSVTVSPPYLALWFIMRRAAS